MKKGLLLLNVLCVCASIACAVPYIHVNQKIAARCNGDMTMNILAKQATVNASNKTTGLKRRFTGFGYSDNGVLTDSNRYYYYSNKRGSVHKDLTSYMEQYYPTSIAPVENIKCDSAEEWSLHGNQLYQTDVKSFMYNNANEVTQYSYRYDITTQQYVYDITYNSAGEISKVATNVKNGTTLLNTYNMFVYYDAQQHRSYDSSYDVINAYPVNKRQLIYDANGNVQSLLSYNWINAAWVLTYRVTHTYDGSNRLITTIRELANSSNVLINNTKDSFAYTGTSTLYTYYKSYDWNTSNGWLYADKITRTLNNQGLVASYVLYANETTPLERIDAYYHSDDLLNYTESFRYVSGNYEANPYDHQTFYYESYAPESVEDVTNNTSLLSVYPNPATDILYIHNPSADETDITIYDAAGKLMYTLKENRDTIHPTYISKWASGTYLVVLRNTKGETATSRFTKQ